MVLLRNGKQWGSRKVFSTQEWVHGVDKLASSWAGPMERTRTCRRTKYSSTKAVIQYPKRLWMLTARILNSSLPDGSRHPGMPDIEVQGSSS